MACWPRSPSPPASCSPGLGLGEAGEIGDIAAAVIDGVKILRIEDLRSEAEAASPARAKACLGRLLGSVADAHSAFKGFTENRKTFLELMDKEQAKARKIKADLAVAIELLGPAGGGDPHQPARLKIEIAAGQIALDRGQEELEALRQTRRCHRRSGRRRRRAGVPRFARQFPRQDRGNAGEPGGLGAADPDHRAEPQGGAKRG